MLTWQSERATEAPHLSLTTSRVLILKPSVRMFHGCCLEGAEPKRLYILANGPDGATLVHRI